MIFHDKIKRFRCMCSLKKYRLHTQTQYIDLLELLTCRWRLWRWYSTRNSVMLRNRKYLNQTDE